MRLNSANRSFFALVATALVPYGLLGLFGCGLLSVVAFRIAADGVGGLTRDGQDLRPAVVFFAVVAEPVARTHADATGGCWPRSAWSRWSPLSGS